MDYSELDSGLSFLLDRVAHNVAFNEWRSAYLSGDKCTAEAEAFKKIVMGLMRGSGAFVAMRRYTETGKYSELGDWIQRSEAYIDEFIARCISSFEESRQYHLKRDSLFPNHVVEQQEMIQYENETIVITDICYIRDNSQGDIICDGLSPYNPANFQPTKPYIYAPTLYGDWSCTTFWNTEAFREWSKETSECCFDLEYPLIRWSFREQRDKLLARAPEFTLGHFCADSDTVLVCAMSDILEFNPKAWTDLFSREREPCRTIIDNFTGTVSYKVIGDKGDKYCYIEGEGNIPFITHQTGF
jgi:hypothetical protein